MPCLELRARESATNSERVGRLKKSRMLEINADFLNLCLDSIYWGPTLIQLGDVVRDNGPLRFDGVELWAARQSATSFLVRLSDCCWSIADNLMPCWCVEVGKPRDLGLLLKCAPSCISKKNMLAYWDVFGEQSYSGPRGGHRRCKRRLGCFP